MEACRNQCNLHKGLYHIKTWKILQINVNSKLLILHAHVPMPSPRTFKIKSQHQPGDQGFKGNILAEGVHMDGVSYSPISFLTQLFFTKYMNI